VVGVVVDLDGLLLSRKFVLVKEAFYLGVARAVRSM